MKILVTGGAGYIGSIMVPMLLDAGHRVTVLDTFQHRQNSLAAVCARDTFSAVRGDCRDSRILKPLVQEADCIIPLAALVGAPLCDAEPDRAQTTNLDAVKQLIGMLSSDQRVVFPVTNSGYGVGEKGKFCDETSPLKPVSLYGRLKVAAEDAVMQHPNAVAFRLATVFGMAPRMRVDLLVNDFTYRAVRDRALVIFQGDFTRNYIHIRDVALGFMWAFDHFEAMRGEVFNMGLSDANLTKIELAERIRAIVPDFHYVEAAIGEDPDKRDYIVSNDKLEATGWRPRYSLDQGIRELVKGYTMISNEVYSNV